MTEILLTSYNMFFLQQMHADEHEYDSGCALLGVGAEYANLKNAYHTKVLFILSKAMVCSYRFFILLIVFLSVSDSNIKLV